MALNQKKKKIVATILMMLVLLLGVGAMVVTVLLQKAQTPTAPTSRPRASEWLGGTSCNVSFTVASPGVINCTDKLIYNDVAANTSGTYTTTDAEKLADTDRLIPGRKYVYVMNYLNAGGGAASAVVTDVLDEKLTFVDSGTRCSYNSTERKVICNINDVAGGATTRSAFRVSVNNNVTGDIGNTAEVAGGGTSCSISRAVAVATIACDSKEAYKNETANSAGNYHYDNVITTVAKNDTVVYDIKVKNTGDTTAGSVTITDVLTGEHQDRLTFLDANPGCNYASSTKTVTCTTTNVAPNTTVAYAFRVKVADGAVNGEVIKNTATVTFAGASTTCTKDLTVSGVVACNHTCTTDAECGSGLICSGNKCRKSACIEQDSCVCPTATQTTTTTATQTQTTTATQTATSTGTATATMTASPTETATQTTTATATSTDLPSAGIINLPGAAAFGGGLLLTILGILFAL